MTACVDKNEAVDADSKPSWLGGSIYQELKNPKYLEGSFKTYLNLVDDLGYAEILDRTGSKTVFPANDSAFAQFFKSNPWGVGSYEQLTTAQKKLLLYSSMLDNALLVDMFSNVSSGSDKVTRGMAMKHQTSLNLIDTIQYIASEQEMPRFNKYWDKYRADGRMHIISDATRSMMVHFTREHMLNNNITTLGKESDFAILTGTPYSEGMAYIFDDQIVKNDVTCQNGYIHQMRDVIVPPGNLAQVLHADPETQFFSHILDYYSAPYENQAVTDTYNAWAKENGQPEVDMIYEVKYFNSQPGHSNNLDPDRNIVSDILLSFDPGWNQYHPNANSTSGTDLSIADIGAMFVPTDDALADFFCKGGRGAYLIDLYGKHTQAANTRENLMENLDSLFRKKPQILTKFVNNLMSSSFIQTVPSKFTTILSDASEYKGISLDSMHVRPDGRYDIKIANNGVIYKMNTMYSPDEYQSVMAPSSTYDNMSIMNWAVQDDKQLGVSFHYYLMAMRANFGFFIPDSAAFERYYVDPTHLESATPRVLKFTYDASNSTTPVRCTAYEYNKDDGTVGNVLNNGANVNISQWKSLMVDILNYHTLVLDDGEVLGDRKYYKTKHGGTVYLPNGIGVGATVASGQQIDNGVPASTIQEVFNEKNGKAFRIDHVIEAPRNSVKKTLQDNSNFSEFLALCNGFSRSSLLKWAGISDSTTALGTTEQDAYIIFTPNNPNASSSKPSANCLDENVKMFNTYNYTLYVPNNDAMKRAYNAGLPKWTDIQILMQQAIQDRLTGDELAEKQRQAKQMINLLRSFARYHFQSSSVYADTKVNGGDYNSLSTNEWGLAIQLSVSGGSDRLVVTDATGKAHTIDATDTTHKSNLMARDYWFNASRESATEIYTSSFCAIHELTDALNPGNLGLTW
jgi:uncharacterized surface protein with fasciclin (FAS1) repeats